MADDGTRWKMAPRYREFFRKHVYRVNAFVSRNTVIIYNETYKNLTNHQKFLTQKSAQPAKDTATRFLRVRRYFLRDTHIYMYIFAICTRGIFGRSETSLMNSLTSLHELYDPDCLLERHIVERFFKFAAFLLHNCKFTGCDRNRLSVTGNGI